MNINNDAPTARSLEPQQNPVTFIQRALEPIEPRRRLSESPGYALHMMAERHCPRAILRSPFWPWRSIKIGSN